MCQLCALKQIATQERWPKPVEAHKKDLNFLVDTIHDDYEAWQIEKRNTGITTTPPEALLDTLRMLSSQLDVLEADREAWWTSPEKRALRKRLEEDCDQRKLSDLHKINNTTVTTIEALSAKLGTFCRWSLGMNGGVWELVNSEKVAKAQ